MRVFRLPSKQSDEFNNTKGEITSSKEKLIKTLILWDFLLISPKISPLFCTSLMRAFFQPLEWGNFRLNKSTQYLTPTTLSWFLLICLLAKFQGNLMFIEQDFVWWMNHELLWEIQHVFIGKELRKCPSMKPSLFLAYRVIFYRSE